MKLRASLVAVLMLCPVAGEAQFNCRVALGSFDFGSYSPADAGPLDITGQINVRCAGRAGTFVATLSTGSSGSFGERHMLSGPHVMRYNLYVDAARTIVWGDGTGGSAHSGGSKPGPGLLEFVLPVYGRVFPRQAVGAGAYGDDVLVTVVF